MHMRAKTGVAGLLSGAAALMMSSSAFAVPTDHNYFDLATTWQDNSAESQWIDTNGDKVLDVGDTLRGILRIPTINLSPSGANPNPGVGNDADLTAIFETAVVSKVSTGSSITYCSAGNAGGCTGTSTAGTFNFSFGATSTGTAGSLANQFGAGVMVAFFTKSTQGTSFVANGCTAGAGGTCETNISTGDYSLYLTLGMNGSDVDEAWIAQGAPDLPNISKAFKSTDGLGTYTAALDVLTNNTGYNFFNTGVSTTLATLFPGGDNFIKGASIEGSIEGNGTGTARNPDGTLVGQSTVYAARDNTTLEFSAALPEPSTLMMFGFGLLGLGALGRRRSRT